MKVEIIKDWVNDRVIVKKDGVDIGYMWAGEFVSETAALLTGIVEKLVPVGTEIVVNHGR